MALLLGGRQGGRDAHIMHAVRSRANWFAANRRGVAAIGDDLGSRGGRRLHRVSGRGTMHTAGCGLVASVAGNL